MDQFQQDFISIMWALNYMHCRLPDKPDRVVTDLDQAMIKSILLTIKQTIYITEQSICGFMGHFYGYFLSRTHPRVNIHNFIEDRLIRYIRPTITDLIQALVIIDHIISAGHIVLDSQIVHRLFATVLVDVVKFNSDSCQTNSYYARVIGIPVTELNNLELVLLTEIGFDLWVKDGEINLYEEKIKEIALYCG